MKPVRDINDSNLAKAMAHPLRVGILGILDARRASPSEMAAELGVRVENVAYHVRMLRQYGLIKLVRQANRGAAIEHYYESVERPRVSDTAWEQLPTVVKRAAVAGSLEQISATVNRAAASGGFDAKEIHLARRTFTFDDQAWKRAAVAYKKLSDDLTDIAAEAAERLRGADHAEQRPAEAVLMLFEPAPAPEAAAPAPARRRTRERETSVSAD